MSEITGIIEKKERCTSENPKAPQGFFYIKGDKYTCWDTAMWGDKEHPGLSEGDEVTFTYKESQYRGYTNRNISNAMIVKLANEREVNQKIKQGPPREVEIPSEKQGDPDFVREKLDELKSLDPEKNYLVFNGKKYKLTKI